MKKAKYIITGLVIIVILLCIMQVVVANSISTSGIQLGKIQSEIASLEKTNEQLHEELLTHASFTYIASEAGQMGFVPAGHAISLTQQTSLALNR